VTSRNAHGSKLKKQRDTNALGLTPASDLPDLDLSSDDDEDEDIDEEAVFSRHENLSLTIEHNGTLVKLQTEDDLKAWIEERRRMFPTQRRIAEKRDEVRHRIQERMRIEQETQQALSGAQSSTNRDQRPWTKPLPPPAAVRRDDKARSGLVVAKINDTEESLQSAQPTDPSPVSPPTSRDPLAAGVTHSSSSSSDSSSDDDDDDTSSSSDSDSAPEETSARPSSGPAAISPPSPRTAKPKPICRAFRDKGHCKYGDKCFRVHEARPPKKAKTSTDSPHGHKTLYQRLREQEGDEENKLAVQAIKYLGDMGFFKKAARN